MASHIALDKFKKLLAIAGSIMSTNQRTHQTTTILQINAVRSIAIQLIGSWDSYTVSSSLDGTTYTTLTTSTGYAAPCLLDVTGAHFVKIYGGSGIIHYKTLETI